MIHLLIAHLTFVGYALYGESIGGGGMNTFEGAAGYDADLASLMGAADEHRSRAPFHLTGIGCYRGIADDASLTLDRE